MRQAGISCRERSERGRGLPPLGIFRGRLIEGLAEPLLHPAGDLAEVQHDLFSRVDDFGQFSVGGELRVHLLNLLLSSQIGGSRRESTDVDARTLEEPRDGKGYAQASGLSIFD